MKISYEAILVKVSNFRQSSSIGSSPYTYVHEKWDALKLPGISIPAVVMDVRGGDIYLCPTRETWVYYLIIINSTGLLCKNCLILPSETAHPLNTNTRIRCDLYLRTRRIADFPASHKVKPTHIRDRNIKSTPKCNNHRTNSRYVSLFKNPHSAQNFLCSAAAMFFTWC